MIKNKIFSFIAVAAKSNNDEIEESKEPDEKFIALEQKYPKRFIWHNSLLSKEEISKLYDLAGVYIQPSFYENAPLCVLEALASGKAIIGTNVGGIPEILGKAGIVSEPNADEISKKALRLLNNYPLRKKYSGMAAERAKEFDWKEIAEKTLKLYKEVIKDNKSPEVTKKDEQRWWENKRINNQLSNLISIKFFKKV